MFGVALQPHATCTRRARVVCHTPRLHAGLFADLAHEEIDEEGNVLAPLGQRRHLDRHDGQTMIQILAETPLADQALQIIGGRGDDPHIDLDPLRTADALELLVDQDAQDLVLGLARHFTDFIEIERTAMRLFESAGATRLARLTFGAEKRHFHALGRDRCRIIQGHEGSVGPRRLLVDHPRHEFLAGAGRPEDHDAAVGGRDLLDRLAKLRDRDRGADQLDRIAGALLQLADFLAKLGILQRAFGNENEAVALNGFSMKS